MTEAALTIGIVLCVTHVWGSGPGAAMAQTRLDIEQALRALTPGQLIVVEDERGQRVRGRSVKPRRQGSSRTLIGAATGLVPGLLLGHGFNTYCNNEGPGLLPGRVSLFRRFVRGGRGLDRVGESIT
jgi:hypothetical protein